MMKYLYSMMMVVCIICSWARAGNSAHYFLKKGYVHNDRGQQCWYTQQVDNDSTYFHGNAKGRMGTVTFDDPICMVDSDGLGLVVIKGNINGTIARWYSRNHNTPAEYKTRVSELYAGSLGQKRGVCMQSTVLTTVGVTLDYNVRGDSITQVRHGRSVMGCTN